MFDRFAISSHLNVQTDIDSIPDGTILLIYIFAGLLQFKIGDKRFLLSI